MMALESENYNLPIAATEKTVERYQVAKTDPDTKTVQSVIDLLREDIEERYKGWLRSRRMNDGSKIWLQLAVSMALTTEKFRRV